jgi:hypothetical protein
LPAQQLRREQIISLPLVGELKGKLPRAAVLSPVKTAIPRSKSGILEWLKWNSKCRRARFTIGRTGSEDIAVIISSSIRVSKGNLQTIDAVGGPSLQRTRVSGQLLSVFCRHSVEARLPFSFPLSIHASQSLAFSVKSCFG